MLNMNRKKTREERITDTVRKGLEDANLKYEYDEENRIFVIRFVNDKVPLLSFINLNDGAMSFVIKLNLTVDPKNYDKTLRKINDINVTLYYGGFYIVPNEHAILYEYDFPYQGADIDTEFIPFLLMNLVNTVDSKDEELKSLAESNPREGLEPIYG